MKKIVLNKPIEYVASQKVYNKSDIITLEEFYNLIKIK